MQVDGAYTGHIHTRRDPQQVEFATGSYQGNTLLAHLQSAFPARAEGSSHGVSVGAGTLL